jgi:MFS transporter, SP family, solute carrier family 2 (myo-inositol transporter), member 13
MKTPPPNPAPSTVALSGSNGTRRGYNRFLLLVAGLGGLLYGIDVGIIGGALPYLEATSGLTASQLSVIVAAVLLGSVFSTLFAGMLADWMGRKPLMILSGLAFVLSIPIIALSHGYAPLFFGRLLQGMSGGFIGIVVPLYLAECLAASNRGKGTGIFQWLLTLGILAAALTGMYFSYHVQAAARMLSTAGLLRVENQAWRSIFWVSLPPGVLFAIGAFFVTESPRWLFRRGRREAAHAALLRSRSEEQAALELREMEETAHTQASKTTAGKVRDSLLARKYVVPFLLACVLLFCNTATGINSVIGYNTAILLQGGLSDLQAHWGYVIFTAVNFLMTIVGVMLVDRKGRRFLFILGTAGIIVSMVGVGTMFLRTEHESVNAARLLQRQITPGQELTLRFDPTEARTLLAAEGPAGAAIHGDRASLSIIYAYGTYTATTDYVRSDNPGAPTLHVTRASCVPVNRVEAFFQNPFGNLKAARTAPLRIVKAMIAPVPSPRHGWLLALGLYAFVAFFAMGPGACIWVALSELMPTRIRSNGMSIALVINQLVSTILAGIFLPYVGKYGYSSMFYLFAGFTVVYFLTVTFLLPETKGKTLEEIEALFEAKAARA